MSKGAICERGRYNKEKERADKIVEGNIGKDKKE
jgi:hypothetical protein